MDYKTLNGIFEGPDKLDPEQKAWLVGQGWKPELSFRDKLTDVVNSTLSGFNEGFARAPFATGDIGNMAVRGVNALRPGTIDPEYEKLTSDRALEIGKDATGIETHKPQTTAGRYANAIAGGVGSGAMLGPAALTIAPRLTAAPTALSQVGQVYSQAARSVPFQTGGVGLVSELAGDASRGFRESEDQNPIVKAVAGVVAGLAGHIQSRMLTPNHARPVYEAAKGMTQADIDQAMRETAKLKAAGATSNTIGDSLPPASQIRAIEREISNTVGGAPLGQKLASRSTEDIPNLVNDAVGQMTSAAVPNLGAIPPTVVDPRKFAVGQAVSNRGKAANAALEVPNLGAQNLPALSLQRIVQQILNKKSQTNLGSTQLNALDNAADTLQATRMTPSGPQVVPGLPGPAVIDPRALRTNMTSVEHATPLSVEATGNRKVDAMGLKDASKIATRLVETESPGIREANRIYRAESPRVELMQEIKDQMLGNRRSNGTVNLPDEAQIRALSAHMEKNPALQAVAPETLAKLEAAQRLNLNSAERGVENLNETLNKSSAANLLNPVGAAGRGFRLSARLAENESLARLFANPTPKNYKILQNLGRYDPELAKAVSLWSNANASNFGIKTEGSK